MIFVAAVILTAGANAASFPADYTNPITTAMPSSSITPDARAGGMGDLGTATTPDMNSQYWNVAKYAMMNDDWMGAGRCRGGLNANYTPWLRKLVSDIDLAYLAGFYNISEMAGTVSASFSYFSMGDVTLTSMAAGGLDVTELGQVRPYELSVDAGYSRKLHEYVSMGVALRFLYSDLNNGHNMSGTAETEMHAAWTMAADIGLYYNQPIDIPMGTSYFRLGFTMKNLGGKMSYSDDLSNFIPTSMNLGASYELPFDDYNKLTFNAEAHKLMVPTKKSKYTTAETALNPSTYDSENPSTWEMSQDAYSKTNAIKGIFQSFADAPYGFAEEMKEISFGVGVEYTYNRQFFGRLGYSHEDYMKGNRRLIEIGAGFHLSIVSLDIAYTIATRSTNPLDQTMRFTLGFDLAGIKDLVDNRRR